MAKWDSDVVVEPALANWKYAPAGGLWLERLTKADPGDPALTLTIQGLRSLGDKKAVSRLKELALMSAAYGIMQRHGGTISCRNNPSGGATFRIALPLQAQ